MTERTYICLGEVRFESRKNSYAILNGREVLLVSNNGKVVQIDAQAHRLGTKYSTTIYGSLVNQTFELSVEDFFANFLTPEKYKRANDKEFFASLYDGRLPDLSLHP
jgi:hypothetical protein